MHRLRPHLGRAAERSAARHDTQVARRARHLLLNDLSADVGADALSRLRMGFWCRPGWRMPVGWAAGAAPADVAAGCGFADQSHFGRWFRRAYGHTPAAYRALCTGVPDRAAGIG